MARDYFPKVREARELLKERAAALIEKYEKLIDAAIANGEYEVAMKALQFLMDHMPDDDGVKMIGASVDKEIVQKGPSAPMINIGVQIGGYKKAPGLLPEAPAIDIEAEEIE